MGAGISVCSADDDSTISRQVKKDGDDDIGGSGTAIPASKFDAIANLLASNYHNHSLLGVGNPLLGEGTAVSPPPVVDGAVSPTASMKKGLARVVPSLRSKLLPAPLPRAERKRLSREHHQVRGLRSRSNRAVGSTQSQNVERLEVDELVGANNRKRALPGQERGQFVERGEMVALARDLGYDITPTQASRLFDMLDPQGQGRIAKGDLLRHCLPLIERVECCGPTDNGPRERRGSAFEPLRRPRPTAPPKRPTAPSRPSGEPPPTAKRWFSPPNAKHWASSAFHRDSRTNAAPGALRPVSPLKAISKKPAKFWATARGAEEGVGDAAASRRSFDNGGGGQMVGRGNVDKKFDRCCEVVAGGSTNAPRSHGLNLVVNKGNRRGTTEGAVRGVAHGERGVVRAGRGGAARAEKGGGSVAVVTVATLPDAPKHERSEGVRQAGNVGNGEGNRDSPDNRSGDTNGYSCLSTSNEALVGRSTTGATEETGERHCTATTLGDALAGKDVLAWTATDVRVWLRSLPRGLAAFAEAAAFLGERVDGKRLAALTLSDLKKKEFHHAKFRAKVPTALWVEIKRIQPKIDPALDIGAASVSSGFFDGQTIADKATRTSLCVVTQFIGQGAFGEVHKVLWTGVGADRGATLAMKTVRLTDITSDERDEYRVLLVEEILTAVRVKPHPNVVNVRFAHIMGFCSENEECLCFEDFVTGADLASLVLEGRGKLYNGTAEEVQGRLLSYAIQLARGLGHIHRCGVLHQDIKSTNVMVSDAGQMLITDFGFATVGHFGPPPPPPPPPPPLPPQQPVCASAFSDASPSLGGATLLSAAVDAKLNPELLSGAEAVEEAISAVSTYRPVSSTDNTVRGDSDKPKGSTGSIPDADHRRDESTLSSGDDASDKREGDGAGGGVVKRERQASKAGFGPVSVGQVQERQNANKEVGERYTFVHDPDEKRPHPIAGCVVSEVYTGTSTVVQANEKVEQQRRDVGAGPGRNCVLFGTLKGLTLRYQSPEANIIVETKENSLRSQAGTRDPQGGAAQNSPALHARDHMSEGQPPYTHRSDMWAAGVLILEMYAGGLAALPAGRGENAGDLLEALVGNGRGNDFGEADGVRQEGCCTTRNDDGHKDVNVGTERGPRMVSAARAGGNDVGMMRREREKLRVGMPEEVLKLLREMFKREAADRPVSMEAVAARLSQALGRLLEKGLVVVPRPSSDAPSPSTLCEQAPASAEKEENHAKLGRLHMWLGKALFMKGEDRREQALQEYREGVRVLQESKADRGSASMALFRWYLGKALLEAGEIAEALPHLVEAVSIDPENAKYRHTLGVAKCATGDEAGAQEELLEAALLDEEDAEDGYQLRMQREREARKTLQKRSKYQDSEEGARQGWPSPSGDEATEKSQAVSTGLSMAGAPLASLRYNSPHRQALEYASSRQPYAFERHTGYRAGRGAVGVGGGDIGGTGRGTVDVGAMVIGDKAARDGGLLCETRRFSIGDQVACGKDEPAAVKATDPLRCYPSTLDGAGVDGAGDSGTYTIDGFLSGEQASLCVRGEAYAATTKPLNSRVDGPDATRSYHLIRMGFGQDSRLPSFAATSTPAAISSSRPLAPSASLTENDEESSTAGMGSKKSGEVVPDISSGHVRNESPGQQSEPSRVFIRSNCVRGGEYIPDLQAAGRAAMVGFHTGLSGALLDFTWGSGELVLVAEHIPSVCATLREALCGSLYRGSDFTSHGAEERSLGAEGAAQRILTIARQTAAAISHCHRRGVLLQNVTPSAVRVTPHWNALLRPNYAHAREGPAWTTVSLREPLPQAVRSTAPRRNDEPFTAPFSDTTRPDYQSPEIAKIRRDRPSHARVSVRALRRSRLSPPPGKRGEQTPPSPSPQITSPKIASGNEASHEHGLDCIGDGGDKISTDDVVGPCGDDHGGGGGGGDLGATTTHAKDRKGGVAQATIKNRRGNYARGGDLSPLGDSTHGSGGQDVSLLGAATGSGLPTVTPCTSDIWAWALIVLEMFSDEAWPPECGQEGLLALEALLGRRTGVDTWTTEDVVSWLRDIGLWSENTEREIRAFKIDGRQLLIPTCRRDVMEKLGLFITDGELSHRLWMNIAGGLQRWAMPPQLARILRRCLADRPEDRFSTMEEVCTLLHEVTTDSGSSGCSTVPTAHTTARGKDQSSDTRRASMILNNIALCLAGEGEAAEAERHYKMALLASEEVPEVHYNLGLLYSTSAYNKYREAQQSFEAAATLMGADDPRRRFSSDHARAAERKSKFYQSEQVMKALSGKYNRNNVSHTESIGTARTARGATGGEDGDDKRRSSTTSEKICSPPWNSSTKKSTGLSPRKSGLPTLPHRSKTARKSSL